MKTHLEDEIFFGGGESISGRRLVYEQLQGWNPSEIPPEHQAQFISICSCVAGEDADKSDSRSYHKVAAVDGPFLIRCTSGHATRPPEPAPARLAT